MTPWAIRTEHLVKRYGAVEALRGLNLEVRQGEIYGFLGPNGAGKTTTIRCLLDLIRPTQGRVWVLGLDPQRAGPRVRAQVGYLPGELRLYEDLTARQTLALLHGLHGRPPDWAYITALAERLHLDLDAPVAALSRGNRQKVGIVQALMHRPALLLLDEPTSGLDPLMQKTVLALLRQAREDGATVFFSSHNIPEVEEIADRVGIIRDGRLVEVLAPEDLRRRAVRRVWVRFGAPAPDAEDALAAVPGVRVLRRAGATWHLEVTGSMDALIKALAAYRVETLTTEQPSLEEVFLAHYRDAAEAPAARAGA